MTPQKGGAESGNIRELSRVREKAWNPAWFNFMEPMDHSLREGGNEKDAKETKSFEKNHR